MDRASGTPSDAIPDVLAIGDSGVKVIFAAMSARHPDGRDAEYLRWHTYDHRPEQYRLEGLRSSMRLVSTPACRGARAASDLRYDAVDHVVSYFFTEQAPLEAGGRLATALNDAGRMPEPLPSIEHGVYHLAGIAAAPRIKVGADVLPWWPVDGVYVLIEQGTVPARDLIRVPGVGGAWWATSDPGNEPMQLTYCFLDDDPIATAERLRPALERRWADEAVAPLLAAPFHPVDSHNVDRHVP